MAKTRTIYVCNNCGEESITWQGRCPTCSQWNTFQEFKAPAATDRGIRGPLVAPAPLAQVSITASKKRLSTNIPELDRVFGGGIIPGSVILIGGEPGIGKSTLLLQVAEKLSTQIPVIYFSGEESEFQVANRAERLG